MTYRIAISGKGGTGKTTFSALLIRALISAGKRPILAIDADPNNCLGPMVGVGEGRTIGDVREELLEKKDDIPAGMSKPQYVQMKVRMAMEEEEDFDLLTMGRPEGPGCYCYVNSVLRSFMDNLGKEYSYMVIDNEAGLEHLSRRTNSNMNAMFILADPSYRAIETAARVRDLAEEMGLKVGAFHLVVSRITAVEAVKEVTREFGFDNFLTVPHDPEIEKAAISGGSLLDLPDESAAVRAVAGIVRENVGGMPV